MVKAALATALVLLAACQQEAPPPADEPAAAGPEPGTPEWYVQSAESAAPAAIAAGATILNWPAMEGGEMVQLRAGTNGWTCLPDIPSTPGPDPMCLDGPGMQWAGAWMTQTAPALPAPGLSYMLAGGSDASNTDPFATEPPEGADWIVSGPHVMIFPVDPGTLDAMSTDHASGAPYVMWQGTPYAHVMMPVQ